MKSKSIHRITSAILAAAFALAPLSSALACSRILWNNNKLAVVVGRTMDWPESTQPVFTILPRGMERNGGMVGPQVLVKENPAKWTSKHGSLVTTIYGIGSADGLNE